MPATRLAVLVILAATVAACAISPVQAPSSFTGVQQDDEGRNAVVSLTDRSGRIRDVEFNPLDADPGAGVAMVPGRPNELDVPWVGGLCDRWTTIDVVGAGAGLAMTIEIEREEEGCDAMGVGKVIRLTLAQPIPPGLVAVTQ